MTTRPESSPDPILPKLAHARPPGALREAHAHLPAHGREMSYLPLGECEHRADALERIAAHAAHLDATRQPGWLLASGMRVQAWDDPRWPTRNELDRLCPARPCLIGSFDHHSAVLNSPALDAVGLRDGDPDPPGGVLGRDRDGRLDGVVLEAAFNLARRAVPDPTPDQWRDILTRAIDDLVSHGFAEVHDLLSPPWLVRTLVDMDRAAPLPVRVRLHIPLDDLAQLPSAPPTSPRVEIAGVKIFVDGTLNARTAWMLAPYREPLPGQPNGSALMSVDRIEDAIRAARHRGLGLAAHAIGDGAVRAVLDAAARASVRPGRDAEPAVRIEHAELIDPADVPRFAELGVLASVQPCHVLYDIEVLRRQLPARLDRVLPLRELIAAGAEPGRLLRFGSDTPIVRPHPMDSVAFAVLRRRLPGLPGGPPSDPIAPEQAITAEQAWQAFAADPGTSRTTGRPTPGL